MTPRRRPLAAAVSQSLPADQSGFGLLGLIITLALSAAVVGVAYVAYGQASITADAKDAAATSAAIAGRVRSAYASAATFDSLNETSALCDGVFPAAALVSGPAITCPGGGVVAKAIRNPWGGSIQLAGTSGAGFALTFEQVASAACPRFVSAAATGWDDVTVNGHSVLSGRKVLPAAAALLCSQSDTSTVQFLGNKGTGAAALPTLNGCVPPAPQTQTIAVAGQVSDVPPYPAACLSQQRTAFCANPYALPAWGPWTNTTSTCAPVCVAPAPTVTPQTQTIPGSAVCPDGQTGSDTWTQSQTRTQSVVHTCSTPIGPVVDQPSTYSPWVNSGGHIGEVNTCAPTCATRLPTAPWVPNPATQTQTVGGSAACPAGQTGSHTWTQKQTSTRTAACAIPGAAVNPVWGAWSAWANSGGKIGEVNTCAPVCGPAPAPVSQTLSCPPPQTGAITQTHGWASAAAPTCWTASAWTTTKNTCVTPPGSTCPAGAPYYGTQGTAVPLSLSVLKGGGGETAAVSNIDFVATSVTGVLTGAYTAKVTYMGQSASISTTCTTQGQTAKNDCDGTSATVTIGGGTFFVTVYAFAPIKGEDASGPWGAKGWTYQSSSAPGCGGTATPTNPVRIQF